MKKRIFSLLMAMVMLLTLSAVAVSAEDAVVEDVPVEDVPVGTGITVTKPNIPEYYVTTKVTNNFPAEAGSLMPSNTTIDPGISVSGEYAVVGGDFSLALEDGKATLTYGEETGTYDLLRLLFKTPTLTGANYLSFHIDTTNLSGSSYFNLRLNNIWTVYTLKTGSVYYFLPDATTENPNPRKESYVVGDTSFEGFKMPAGVTGTIYLPETSFVNSSYNAAEFDNYLQWSCDHDTRQNAALYLENKQEYDGGAVVGDNIVFSNMCWVKEDSVTLNMPYNAEYMFNDYSATATGNASFTAINAWDNWRTVRIDKAFDSSFEALKFDLDYSQFTLATDGNTIKFYYSFRDSNWDYHNFWVSGEVYLIWEDGKVVTLEAGGSTKQIPAGFKGSVIIPFASFGADSPSKSTVNPMDIFSAGQNEYSLSMQVYGNESETALTAYVDNVGFLTTYNATDLVSARAQIMEEAFEETEKTVDVNGDGTVDALDIVALKKIVSWAA